MSAILNLMYFQGSYEESLTYLARLKKDNELYAEKPNANLQAVSLRREVLENLFSFMQKAHECVKALEEERAGEYKRGFRAGYDKARKDSKNTVSHWDKEGIRLQNINNVRSQMPNLF